MSNEEKPATLLIFSDSLDRATAAFLVAVSAASIGREVSLYFAFWGLNVVRKKRLFKKKNLLEKMLTVMLPRSQKTLPLSKMNMAGLGPVFLKTMMAQKKVESLPNLIQTAKDLGVKMTACEMSMDVMGVSKEELMDGLEFGGVASYVCDASDSGLTLFV